MINDQTPSAVDRPAIPEAPDGYRVLPRPLLVTIGVLIAAFVVLLMTFSPGSDGVAIVGSDVIFQCHFAAKAGNAGSANPHHLLIHFLAWGVAALRAGGSPDIVARIVAHQFLSALATVLGAFALYRLLASRIASSTALAISILAILAAGPWLLAAAGENVPPASAALAFLLFGLVRARLEDRAVGIMAPSLVFVLALLLRQDSVLALPAIFLLLPLRRALSITVIAGLTSFVVYVLAWMTTDRSLVFFNWLVKLARAGPWGHRPDLSGLDAAWKQQLATLVGRPGIDVALQLGIVATLLLLVLGVRSRRQAGLVRVLPALAIFVLARIGFGLWWEPVNIEVWTPNLLPLLAIFGLSLGRIDIVRRCVLYAVVAIVVIVNARWVIAPLHGQELEAQVRAIKDVGGPKGRYVLLDFNLAAAFRRESIEGSWVEDQRLVGWIADLLSRPEATDLRSWLDQRRLLEETLVFVRDRDRGQPFGRDVLIGLQRALHGELKQDAQGLPWMLVLAP